MVSDQHRQLTTLAGWRCFAGEVPSVPELLAGEVWAALQDDKRLAYDEDRLDHHSRLLVIETAVIVEQPGGGLHRASSMTSVTADHAARSCDRGGPMSKRESGCASNPAEFASEAIMPGNLAASVLKSAICFAVIG